MILTKPKSEEKSIDILNNDKKKFFRAKSVMFLPFIFNS